MEKKLFLIVLIVLLFINLVIGGLLFFKYNEYKETAIKVEQRNEYIKKKQNDNKKLEDDLASVNNTIIEKEKLLSIRIEELKVIEEKNKAELLLIEEKKKLEHPNIKIAYLTFDDGPSDNTNRILDILKANDIKATFFVNGHPTYKDLYLRIKNEGHTIGNHTYVHAYDKVYKNPTSFFTDVDNLNNYLQSIGIEKSNVLRFPGGSNNTVSFKYGGETLMNKITKEVVNRGYQYYDWNVSSGDASAKMLNKNQIVNNVLNGARGKNEAVILMHDTKPKITTFEALQEIINGLKAQGFSFKKIEKETGPIIKFK